MKNSAYTMWIGTNSVRGSLGIYTVQAAPGTLELSIVHTQEAYNSGALAYDTRHDRLFAVSEGMIFDGQACGGVISYTVNESGELEQLGCACTVGQRPCSVAIDPQGENVYTASFFGGSLTMLPVRPDGTISLPRRVIRDPIRTDWFHAMHCVGILDSGKTVAVLSVTQSSLLLYDTSTCRRTGSFYFGEKVFVRSFAAHGEHVYVMLQDPGSIYVLRRAADQLMKLQTVQIQPSPPDFYGTSAIRITPNGSLLLAGVRRTNSIAVFRIGPDGCLVQTDSVTLPGETPRDFAVSPDGKVVVIALQASDEICIHSIDYTRGTLVLRQTGLRIPSPAAVVIRKETI